VHGSTLRLSILTCVISATAAAERRAFQIGLTNCTLRRRSDARAGSPREAVQRDKVVSCPREREARATGKHLNIPYRSAYSFETRLVDETFARASKIERNRLSVQATECATA